MDSSRTFAVFAGACVELMAALALAYPGYVSATIMSTHLFSSKAYRALTPQPQQSHITSNSLSMLAYAQRTWESAHGRYPITLAFLQLTLELVNAGVSAESVKVSQTVSLKFYEGKSSSVRKPRAQIFDGDLEVGKVDSVLTYLSLVHPKKQKPWTLQLYVAQPA